ncbi:hypothetical protein Atai01_02690 [Amycolatopsis taiwanensis]|uniref:Uncharacterized protein n=1 Tax=Amycolatopsis taiwanensis TaxID=342230 RepID=A0A9W6VCD2_9PSEU|nr:hypothetical protein Atai01_02690 [Amycolatopsis taiwanensis]
MARQIKMSLSSVPSTVFRLAREQASKVLGASGKVPVSFDELEARAKRIEEAFGPGTRSEPVDPEEAAKRRKFLAHAARVTLEGAVTVAVASLEPFGQSAKPTRLSSGLTSLASSWLPADRRADYAEEFRGDLGALAQQKHGRLKQLLYALCVLIRVPQLRRALRTPALEAGEQPR